jgi:hypothetical protein
MKIINSCKAAGLPVPTLEEDGGGFIVKLLTVFRKKNCGNWD